MRDSDLQQRLQSAFGQAFTLERELGGGGMSRVFLATENALGRQVVIKVLPPHMAEGVSTERFTREVRLAARLQHPHIVPLLSAGEADRLPWFSMPFVDGESLRAKLSRTGELPIADAVRVLREVANALAYAHGRGVVHRDIKPENILLSQGTAMVSDFGVSKALAEAGESGATGLTSLGVALGTPAYMAPEQGMADPRTDQRADLYAFGVVAYEVLTGRTPFHGRSPQATLAAHVTETPEPLERLRSTTPPALASLVMQCLAKSPADRPQSAQSVVHQLDALTTPSGGTSPHVSAVVPSSTTASGAPLPSSAPELPVGLPPIPRQRGRRSATMIALGAGLLVIAVGGWYASSRFRGPALADRRIAVAPFDNLTGSPDFDVVGRMAADWLTQGIARAESVDVVSSMAVTEAMTDAPKGPDVVSRLSRATGASVIVSGSIYAQGDSLRMQSAVFDARTGKQIRLLDPVTAPKSDPMIAIKALQELLLGAMAVGDAPAGMLLRAPKYTAYREMLTGLESFARQRYAESRPFFSRAIALDSLLIDAYTYLAVSYANQSMWDSSEAVTAQVRRFADRMTAHESLNLEWLEANLSGSDERQLAAAEKAMARDSVAGWSYLTGLHANALLRGKLSLAALLRSDSTMVGIGWFPQVNALANAYHMNGRHEDELAMLRRRRRDFPSLIQLPVRDLRALGAIGRTAEARALADTVLRGITNLNGNVITGAVLNGAMEFEAHHGDTATANALARQVIQWHQSHPNKAAPTARLLQEGRAWLIVGGLDSARAVFTRATRDTASLSAAGHLGLVFALSGDTARARTMADSLGSLRRKWLFGGHNEWRGTILAALGEREAALRLLQQSFVEGQSKLGLHFAPTLRSLRGYPPFEALLTPER